MKKLILLFLIPLALFSASITNQERAEKEVQDIKKPLYNPFVENYILHEIKALRAENRKLRVELTEKMAKKELELTDRSVNYATSTINNMFYIIAAATTLLVFIGLSSFKDMNEKVKVNISDRVSKVISEYEDRMITVEKNLEQRSQQVLLNQEEISKTNTIHSLWMRAGLESTPQGKIEIYDQILKLRPDDSEVLSSKAESVLDMGEINWALSICNHALTAEDGYPNALYQRACAYSLLGYPDNAIDDLSNALSQNESYVEQIEKDHDFDAIRENEKFISLIDTFKKEDV